MALKLYFLLMCIVAVASTTTLNDISKELAKIKKKTNLNSEKEVIEAIINVMKTGKDSVCDLLATFERNLLLIVCRIFCLV